MLKLKERSPAEGLLPLRIGGVGITEDAPGHMTLLMPFKGQAGGLGDALKAAHGMAMPAANRVTGREGARALWFGRGDQVMLMGPAADAALAKHAAVVDQSDAWVVIRLEGAGARDVLARLVPLDLRPARFKRGHAARTLIGHMSGAVARVGDTTWQLMVFRSMARTLVHECETAARGVASRAGA